MFFNGRKIIIILLCLGGLFSTEDRILRCKPWELLGISAGAWTFNEPDVAGPAVSEQFVLLAKQIQTFIDRFNLLRVRLYKHSLDLDARVCGTASLPWYGDNLHCQVLGTRLSRAAPYYGCACIMRPAQ